MMTQNGSFRLFRVAGIDVFLHWSWIIIAIFAINNRRELYSSLAWSAAEYVALFAIVLLHEFGHALACRQVGGQADRIVLWPLGGLAFVAPPPRPGATLWSVAAGPLVNVILLPIALVLAVVGQSIGWGQAMPDALRFLWAMVYINIGLLMFNLLPIYPLDGGQMLRAVLWFFVGRVRSLQFATVVGFFGAAGLIGLAVMMGSIWIGVLAIFMFMTSWRSWKSAGFLSRLEQLPRRVGFACPACKTAPPIGEFWICKHCGTPFDTFASTAACPKCQAPFAVTACVHCGASRPVTEWMQPRMSIT